MASPTATFSLPEIKRGIYAGAGGLPRLIKNFGMQLASDIALTGRVLRPDELKNYGFLRISSTPASLIQETIDLAREIVKHSPDSILVTRAALREAWETASVERSAQLIEDRYSKALLEGENTRIGLEAFAKKQEPKWVASKL